MDVNAILNGLPTAPNDVVSRLVRGHRRDLGGEYTVVRRVSMVLPPDLNELRCGITRRRRRGWVAECTCTACAEVWHTQWNAAGLITVYEGPDAQIYPLMGEMPEDDITDGFLSPYSTGGRLICPECDAHTTVVFSSELRTPKRTTRAFQTVERIGSYGAVVAWLGSRRVDRNAFVEEQIVPWKATVVDETRKLHSFSFEHGRWKPCRALVRPELTIYNTPDGGVYGRMIGTFISTQIPPLVGTTLEKTGLREYLVNGGAYPTEYLRFWSCAANIENLMKTPFAGAVQSIMDCSMGIDGYNDSRRNAHFAVLMNLEQVNPHLMLEMDKQSFRHFCREDTPIWSGVALMQWLTYRDRGGKLDAVRFHEMWLKYKADGMDTMLEMMADVPGLDIDRIDWYLVGKQGLLVSDLHLIPDMWRFSQQIYLRPLTNEERWPRRLLEAHDRLSALVAVKDSEKLQASFDRTRAELRPLEFSDGELCVVIPASNAELIREGDVLRHCVGTYGERHCLGAPIFFIRHHRRPERPYYTLNIDLTKAVPERVQLHGYGNERHGEHKQYTHKIPKKVLDFCDRWEREVLAPWWQARQKEVTA